MSRTAVTPEQFAAFGDLLKYLRRRAGLTQRELSIAVGYSDTQISRLEQNQRVPGAATLTALFVPALHIEQEPEWAARLLELAVEGRRDEALTPVADVPAPPTPRHNLPLQLTSFIGREHDIAEVKRLLSMTRLLTLTGSGGCGKTRLSLQVAADLSPSFANGAWFIELALLADPTFVPQIVATTLGQRVEGNRPVLEALAENLRRKSILLILDNCEHLIDSCAHLADALLSACPDLHILASSREALGVPGETAFRIPSLSLPQAHEQMPVETLVEYEAVRLFVERASAALPDFEVTRHNAPAIVEVCRRLDGIPLAIELAAARVGVLRVEQIAARLNDRFRLLTGGSRTALPRHQTLRATMDWSYDLLQDDERILFRRTSVFAGGWTIEAAEAICGWNGLEKEAVLDALTRLVNKSLVVAERHLGAEARYRLLETTRQYAQDKLLEADEVKSVRARHFDFFLEFALTAKPKLRGPEQLAWFKRLDSERDNLRAALDWALESGQAQSGLRLGAALETFWLARNCWTDGGERLERLLARPEAAEHTLARAAALNTAGIFAIVLCNYEAARAWLEESQRISLELGAEGKPCLGWSLAHLGGEAVRQFNPFAQRLLDESLVLARESGETILLAYVLDTRGVLAIRQGDYALARTLLSESLALFRKMDDRWGSAYPITSLGYLLHYLGDYGAARSLHQEALTIYREVGDRYNMGDPLEKLSDIAQLQGDYEGAMALNNEFLTISRDLSDKWSEALSLRELGLVASHMGDFGRAVTLFTECLPLFQELGNQYGLAACLIGWAGLTMSQTPRRPLRAAKLLGAAEAILETIDHPLRPHHRIEYEGIVAAARAQLDEAAFNTAWAEGRAMTMEGVIEYALATDASRSGCNG